ncbi:MAG: UDP-N-acetylmuramoyl-L-alanine--D-glutamate ligase [Puniceicoccales bacterium]
MGCRVAEDRNVRVAPDELSGRQIPVLGMGASGRAAATLLERRGMVSLLFDEKVRGAIPGFSPRRGDYPFGVISPGFSPDHPWRIAAAKAGLPLLAEVELGASAWEGSLFCITGTNGKTTLTCLLEQALNAAGEEAASCGNIGRPLSDLAAECLNPGWAICELSSFQLHDWDQPTAEAAIWTNFAEDHLDWHSSLELYFGAKWKLVESGIPVFAGADVKAAAESYGYSIPSNLVVVEDLPENRPASGLFAHAPFSRLYALARAWWIQSGRAMTALEESAITFARLPHRLEPLGKVEGRSFFNDSKGTNFHAALAACDCLEKPIAWIGGGVSKGGDLSGFARELAQRIESADLFGRIAGELGRFLEEEGMVVRVHTHLEDAVYSAFTHSSPPANLLLSPGFASFDQFSGYAERGEAFRKCVFGLLNRAESI